MNNLLIANNFCCGIIIKIIIVRTYRGCVIITHWLVQFKPTFEGQKRLFKGFFLKILALGMVGIQKRFIIRAGYDRARTVYIIHPFQTFDTTTTSNLNITYTLLIFLEKAEVKGL